MEGITLEERIKEKTAIVGVIGLGYVGLPLALAFAEAGFKVLGLDINQERVDSVNSGKSYMADVSDEQIIKARRSNRFEATTDQKKLSDVSAICICVPTPLTKTKDPDLSHVIREAEIISSNLRSEQLVILESTTYPGTTREVVLPLLKTSGLKEGVDFYLAFSPERVDPGSQAFGIRNTPKLVGGIDPESTRLAELLYSEVTEVTVPVSCPEAAEMTKVFENVFRSVNIALVNELSMLCEKMGISVWEVIDAASTKPFGYMPFYPGPGIGGHCIPLDPYYLANKAREYDFHTRFIELAAEINEQMPYYVISRISQALNERGKSLNGASILVLGLAYKRDVADVRESPSLKLAHLLDERKADLSYNDPYIEQIRIADRTFTSVELTEMALKSSDCVVIATDHSSYDYEFIIGNAHLIFDTKGSTRKVSGSPNIIML